MCKNKSRIDLPNGNVDGSHTSAIRGGEQIAYQGRKKRKTTNALYLTDSKGLILCMSEPIAGNYNDLFDISIHFKELINSLSRSKIETSGLFLNLDAGFDSKELRSLCQKEEIFINVPKIKWKGNSNEDNDDYFDEELYEKRYVIERSNAWCDSYRSILNHFDTAISSWKGFNYLSFIIMDSKNLIQKVKMNFIVK